MSNPNFLPFYTVDLLTTQECLKVIDLAHATGWHDNLLENQVASRYCYVDRGELFDLVEEKIIDNLDRLNPYDFDLFDPPVTQVYVWWYQEGNWLNEHTDYQRYKGCNTRKVNLTTALNEGFEGGDLTLTDGDHLPLYQVPTGTCAVYPAWAPHRVTKINRGVRYSLAAWLHGPSFR